MANAFFFILKIKTVSFRLKLTVFNSCFFMIFIINCSFLFILILYAQLQRCRQNIFQEGEQKKLPRPKNSTNKLTSMLVISDGLEGAP